MMNTQAPPAAIEARQTFVVAVKDIMIGTMIRPDDVDLLPPSENIQPKLGYQDIGEVLGKVVRRNIAKGEALKKVDILAEGDNLASLIPRGYRAMTIPVTLPASITEMLQIGNRVDVILTYEASRNELKSVTLLENARVIGVSNPSDKASGSQNRNLDITLAVTPEGAETLAFAQKRGTLNLSIRSLDEEGTEKFFTLRELFFPDKKEDNSGLPEDMLQIEKPSVPTDVIEIIRGVSKEQYAAEWQTT